MTNNHPIIDILLDAFDAHDAAQNDCPITIRSMMLDLDDYTLTIARIDDTDDCATLNIQLDDELNELTMIAIFNRDDLTIRRLILHSDNELADII